MMICCSSSILFSKPVNLRPTLQEAVQASIHKMEETSPVRLVDDVKKAILYADNASKIISVDRLKMNIFSHKGVEFYYLDVHVETLLHPPYAPVNEGIHYTEFLVVKNSVTPKKIEIYAVNIFDTPFQGKLDHYLTPKGIALLVKQKALLPQRTHSPKKHPAKKQ